MDTVNFNGVFITVVKQSISYIRHEYNIKRTFRRRSRPIGSPHKKRQSALSQPAKQPPTRFKEIE
jgi:hypothetical protein